MKVPERWFISQVKGDVEASKRVMVLPAKVLGVLRIWQVRQKEEQLRAGPAWNNEHNLIFTTEIGTAMTNMDRRINKLLATTDLGHWSISELTRHSFATLIEADLQPQIMERAMGHAPGSSERRHYIHRQKAIVTDHLKVMDNLIEGQG